MARNPFEKFISDSLADFEVHLRGIGMEDSTDRTENEARN